MFAAIPAVRQKRSNELSTSCQAVSMLGTSANGEVVVVPVMALLSFAEFDTPSLTAQGGQRLLPNSTSTGAIPRRMWGRRRARKPRLFSVVTIFVVVHPTKRADLSRHGYGAAQFKDALARFLTTQAEHPNTQE